MTAEVKTLPANLVEGGEKVETHQHSIAFRVLLAVLDLPNKFPKILGILNDPGDEIESLRAAREQAREQVGIIRPGILTPSIVANNDTLIPKEEPLKQAA